MVAVIKTGHSVYRIFNYNENKVKAGVAICIGAGNYPADVEKLSSKMKINRLLNQAILNENVRRNSVHISLNFDASDTGLSKEKLMEIADAYMQKIGFGNQPFLVYQHFDAAHPHVHIITVKVRDDGSRIDMHNIGKNQSENARKEIEKAFGLAVADERKMKSAFRLQPVNAEKAQYGRTETKRAITNVLGAVLEKYKYTSLAELNAVLKQYNVLADRCGDDSRTFKTGGLVYRILDGEGKPVGVPIKASNFYNKPTLKVLQAKFASNIARRLPHKARVKNEIDRLFIGKISNLEELIHLLAKKGIYVALRGSETGMIYGITYVDNQTKCVFNGSALGKRYSAKAIQQRCLIKEVPGQDLLSLLPVREPSIGLQSPATAATETRDSENAPQHFHHNQSSDAILDSLLQVENSADYVSGQLKKKSRKKKKRKNISNNQ